jgi:hypothetical protein
MTNLTRSFSMYLFHACTCFEQQVLIIRRANLYQYIIWYNTLVGDCLTCRSRGKSWPARQTVTHQSVLYQMMYWYKLVLLMMSTCCSKHVGGWNKYIEKECVKLVINQNYVEMHGQQNISYIFVKVHSFIGFNNIVFGVFYHGLLPLIVLIPIIFKTEGMSLNFNGGNTCLLYDDT